MDIRPFQPKAGGTIAIANAIAASTPASLDESCDAVALYNTSETATAYWRCQSLPLPTTAGANAVVPVAAGAQGDMPIPPGGQIRLTVGSGLKKFSVIASAADGTLFITPGVGN